MTRLLNIILVLFWLAPQLFADTDIEECNARQVDKWLADKSTVQIIYEKDNTEERLPFGSEKLTQLTRELSMGNGDNSFHVMLSRRQYSHLDTLIISITFKVDDDNKDKLRKVAQRIESEGFHIRDKKAFAYKLTDQQRKHLTSLIEDINKNIMADISSQLGVPPKDPSYGVYGISYHYGNEKIKLSVRLAFYDMSLSLFYPKASRIPELYVFLPYLGYTVVLYTHFINNSNHETDEVVKIVKKHMDRLITLDDLALTKGDLDIKELSNKNLEPISGSQ